MADEELQKQLELLQQQQSELEPTMLAICTEIRTQFLLLDCTTCRLAVVIKTVSDMCNNATDIATHTCLLDQGLDYLYCQMKAIVKHCCLTTTDKPTCPVPKDTFYSQDETDVDTGAPSNAVATS